MCGTRLLNIANHFPPETDRSQTGFSLAQLRRTEVRPDSLWRNCAGRKSDRIPFGATAPDESQTEFPLAQLRRTEVRPDSVHPQC
jgi:hypothetical protein